MLQDTPSTDYATEAEIAQARAILYEQLAELDTALEQAGSTARDASLDSAISSPNTESL